MDQLQNWALIEAVSLLHIHKNSCVFFGERHEHGPASILGLDRGSMFIIYFQEIQNNLNLK